MGEGLTIGTKSPLPLPEWNRRPLGARQTSHHYRRRGLAGFPGIPAPSAQQTGFRHNRSQTNPAPTDPAKSTTITLQSRQTSKTTQNPTSGWEEDSGASWALRLDLGVDYRPMEVVLAAGGPLGVSRLAGCLCQLASASLSARGQPERRRCRVIRREGPLCWRAL